MVKRAGFGGRRRGVPALERYFAVRTLEVRSWGPVGSDGPSEVHLVIDVTGVPLPVVLKLRTAAECDRLVTAIFTVAGDVFGRAT